MTLLDRPTIARLIIDQLSTVNLTVGHTVPAHVVALVVLLDEREHTVSEIRDALGVSQASASDYIKDAVDLGLVEHTRHRFDHRVRVCGLTVKGGLYRAHRRGLTRE